VERKKFVKIDGGIGRCIASIGALLKCKRDLSIVTGFPSIFDGIVDRPYPIGTHYLYEDHIKQGDFSEPEPYNHYKFYSEGKHLAQVYNFLLNGVDEYVAPKIILSPSEEEFAKQYIDGIKHGSVQKTCDCEKCKNLPKKRKIKKKKKVMLFQPYAKSGGTRIPDETFRSLTEETISKFVDTFSKDHTILMVRAPNQATVSDTIPFTHQDIRRIIAVIPRVDVVVCCDSFVHHAVAALGNPVKTIVLWGGTSEKNFGYKGHTHLRVKDIEVEPNRVPHNHSYYVNKNKGCNDFTSKIKEIKEIINGGTNNKRSSKQGNGGSKCSKGKRTKAHRN